MWNDLTRNITPGVVNKASSSGLMDWILNWYKSNMALSDTKGTINSSWQRAVTWPERNRKTWNQKKKGYCSISFLPNHISHTDAPNIISSLLWNPHLCARPSPACSFSQELKVSCQCDKSTARCRFPWHTACANWYLNKLQRNRYLVAQNITERHENSTPPECLLAPRAALLRKGCTPSSGTAPQQAPVHISHFLLQTEFLSFLLGSFLVFKAYFEPMQA